MHKCIFNGVVVTYDALLPHHAVVINNDRIEAILSTKELERYDDGNEEMEFFDAHGGYIMPGFIDIHSDYIEGVIQPRPTSVMNFEMGLRETEKQLLGQGITTMYHSLSLMKERFDFEQKSIRKPDNVDKLVKLIKDFHIGYHLIRHRFHARYEIDNLEIFSYLEQLIRDGLVHELSFMDHTPGQGQYRDVTKSATLLRHWNNLSDADLERFIADSQQKPKATHEMLLRLSKLAREYGIPLASHDDDSMEKVELVKREYGAGISEFPITMEVAHKAHEEGLMVVVGAPNIMLGSSHAGNLCAIDAIKEGCADILCSDYYPAALLHAVFKLCSEGVLPLAEGVRMVTANPAKAMNIDRDFGVVAVGKKADLLVVRLMNGCPMIYKVFIDGRVAMQFQYRLG